MRITGGMTMYMFLEAFGAVVSLPSGSAGEGFLLLDGGFDYNSELQTYINLPNTMKEILCANCANFYQKSILIV